MKAKERLTAAQIDAAKPGTTLEAGAGLRCTVGVDSVKWVFRYTSPVLTHKRSDGTETKTRREMGLGRGLGLKAARAKVDELRKIVRSGHDPLRCGNRGAA